MKRTSLLSLLLLTLYLLPPALQAEEPVVRAVLFWSAACPHCHVVLNETLPKIQERYGDQLQVLAVEASAPDGYLLWLEALDEFQVPSERQAVPMLVIGDQVLVGELEIAGTLPDLIEAGAAAGGLDYPALPGLAAFLPATAAPPEASLQHVTDLGEFLKYGLLFTPGLVINERLVCAGRIPRKDEVVAWLKEVSEAKR